MQRGGFTGISSVAFYYTSFCSLRAFARQLNNRSEHCVFQLGAGANAMREERNE